jgi:hypothetical protein
MKQSLDSLPFPFLNSRDSWSVVEEWGLVQALFPMKVQFWVATGATSGRRAVLGPETLQGSPGLNQGAVHSEMLVSRQSHNLS